jgi:hypothetical protein
MWEPGACAGHGRAELREFGAPDQDILRGIDTQSNPPSFDFDDGNHHLTDDDLFVSFSGQHQHLGFLPVVRPIEARGGYPKPRRMTVSSLTPTVIEKKPLREPPHGAQADGGLRSSPRRHHAEFDREKNQ